MKYSLLIVAAAGIIWFGVGALTTHLAEQPNREHQAAMNSAATAGTPTHSPSASAEEIATAPVEVSQKAKDLIAAAESAQDNVQAQIAAADALYAEADGVKNQPIVMQAMTLYSRALSLDPKQSRALQVMGDLSFEVGMYDRAAEYFRRYLELDPEDPKVIVAYALSHLGADRKDKALEILKQAQQRFPKDFGVLLTLALTHQRMGQRTETEQAVAAALEVAPDDTAKSVANSLLTPPSEEAAHDHSHPVTATAEATSPTDTENYRTALEEFFRTHQILGSKLVSITWSGENENTALVQVRNFPLDAMPDFAKDKLRARIQEVLASRGNPTLSVRIAEFEKPQSVLSFDF